ncbi:MAG: DCC1-like thiol-disulfide oxidoreductase family protein [Verrucomicrobia bacterium]|nr:DCC1-like thiol-disulfide oxidoreductase family protein [Verrucomicrobiota bacterium]
MNPDTPKGWILYDDSCGFCRRWIPFWQGALLRRGFAVAPLQADWVREKTRLGAAELLEDLRLLLADGTMIRGADVYRHATRRIWWAWPVYLFSVTPLLRKVFDWGYRIFAANRVRVSGFCGLPPGN